MFCLYVYACMYMNHVCAWQASSEDGVSFPGTTVPHGYEPYGCWELSSHPWQELQVLITAGSSLCPNFKFRKDPIGEAKGYANLTYQVLLRSRP